MYRVCANSPTLPHFIIIAVLWIKWGRYYYNDFAYRKAEAMEMYVTCSLHGKLMAKLKSWPKTPNFSSWEWESRLTISSFIIVLAVVQSEFFLIKGLPFKMIQQKWPINIFSQTKYMKNSNFIQIPQIVAYLFICLKL